MKHFLRSKRLHWCWTLGLEPLCLGVRSPWNAPSLPKHPNLGGTAPIVLVIASTQLVASAPSAF